MDDGKSTLIGRLLYDSRNVYEDQIKSVRQASVNRTAGAIDFSLLTDGLRAEREQGITIDVAYRYFSTTRRKFIIADTPGHVQYTRNMATGASTADLAIILMDARNGVLPQSRRHAYIASLLGIPHIVVAVNKMDLVDFGEARLRAHRAEFTEFSAQAECARRPLPAHQRAARRQRGARRARVCRGSTVPACCEYLETVHIASARNMPSSAFRCSGWCGRTLNFRGYAGQIASGAIQPGDAVMALPSGAHQRCGSIAPSTANWSGVSRPCRSRWCWKTRSTSAGGTCWCRLRIRRAWRGRSDARMVWMQEQPLQPGREYLLKHTTQTLRATVAAVRYRVNIDTLEKEPAGALGLNEIGAVVIETRKPLFSDPYRRNRATGSFILIDPMSNSTVAAGMITGRPQNGAGRETLPAIPAEAPASARRITRGEQQERAGHRAATVWVEAAEAAYGLERLLFDAGCRVHAMASGAGVAETARALNDAGVIAIVDGAGDAALRERTRLAVGEESFIESALEPQAVRRLLEERGVLPGS